MAKFVIPAAPGWERLSLIDNLYELCGQPIIAWCVTVEDGDEVIGPTAIPVCPSMSGSGIPIIRSPDGRVMRPDIQDWPDEASALKDLIAESESERQKRMA